MGASVTYRLDGVDSYYSLQYRTGFRLECVDLRRVRLAMALTNMQAIVPFCRTVAEGRKVVILIAGFGLKQR